MQWPGEIGGSSLLQVQTISAVWVLVANTEPSLKTCQACRKARLVVGTWVVL